MCLIQKTVRCPLIITRSALRDYTFSEIPIIKDLEESTLRYKEKLSFFVLNAVIFVRDPKTKD